MCDLEDSTGKGLEGVGCVRCSLVVFRFVVACVQRLSVTTRMVKTLVAAQREFVNMISTHGEGVGRGWLLGT